LNVKRNNSARIFGWRLLQLPKSIAGCYAAHAFTFTSLPLSVLGSTWSSVSLPVSRQRQFEHNKKPKPFICARASPFMLIINASRFYPSARTSHHITDHITLQARQTLDQAAEKRAHDHWRSFCLGAHTFFSLEGDAIFAAVDARQF
jgi:hypothetical protein